MTRITPAPTHVDVGAYVLGILDEVDHNRFEAHLVECHQCQAELQALSALPDVLDAIRDDETIRARKPEIGDRVLIGALDEVAAMRRRRRQATWLAVAAAAVLIVAAPLAAIRLTEQFPTQVAAPPGGSALTSGNSAPKKVVSGTGANGVTTVDISITGKPWGSAIELELSGISGPLRCHLVALSRSGDESVVGSWSVPEAGYGPQNPLKIQGGAAIPATEISKFEIRSSTGQHLLDVKV
jgi:hypothetical protein